MKKTIPNSNSIVLTGKEWILTVALAGIISFSVYFGWDRWEKIGLEPDYRSTCWAERMSDYWAYEQWSRIAREKFKILLIGDSAIWGQEVASTETISHCLNATLGNEAVANLGIDGLSNAAMEGLFRYYGRHIRHMNVILQFNPLWMSSPWRDMRENWTFHHPRLVRQLDRRIHYYRGLSERLGYLLEQYLLLPPFVRHLMVNYFENKSIAVWLLDHPFQFPPGAITFKGAPVMREKQGLGTPWSSRKEAGKFDDPFLLLDGSVQWECYLGALKLLKDKGNRVFVLLGPYNTYNLSRLVDSPCHRPTLPDGDSTHPPPLQPLLSPRHPTPGPRCAGRSQDQPSSELSQPAGPAQKPFAPSSYAGSSDQACR